MLPDIAASMSLTPYNADWDYSIDEIQFYKGTPPTGPAAHGDGGP
jgi:hypothetical protein